MKGLEYLRSMKTKDWNGALECVEAETVGEMGDLLRQMAHLDRLRIVDLLNEAGELPVCQITDYLGIAQASTSKHLVQMRRAGVLQAERRGKAVWYSVADRRCISLLRCICQCCETKKECSSGR